MHDRSSLTRLPVAPVFSASPAPLLSFLPSTPMYSRAHRLMRNEL